MSEATNDAGGGPDGLPGWTRDLLAAAAALRELGEAQLALLGAELRLARGAVRLALAATLAIVVLVIAAGLSLLALLAVALAHWLGSWVLALLVLVAAQVLLLLLAVRQLRRCLHWMSLPETRAQWRALTEPEPPRAVAPEAGDAARRAA